MGAAEHEGVQERPGGIGYPEQTVNLPEDHLLSSQVETTEW